MSQVIFQRYLIHDFLISIFYAQIFCLYLHCVKICNGLRKNTQCTA